MITTKLKDNTLFVTSTIDGTEGMEEVKAELNAFVLASGIRLDINAITNQIGADGLMYWYFRLWGKGLNAYNSFKTVGKIDKTFGGVR